MPKLAELNALGAEEFTRIMGPVFEHSPWVAERAAPQRPFASRDEVHSSMCRIVEEAAEIEKLALIRAHPDLVGRAALTPASQAEQTHAGLTMLSDIEKTKFQDYNRAYRAQFDFPFVICARMSDKQAMLEAFVVRLENTREQELETALTEIFKIAKLRLADLIDE